MGTLSWKNEEVGQVSNLINDMWYFEVDWLSNNSEHALKFESIAVKLNAEEVRNSPETGMIVLLKSDDSSLGSKFLVLSLDQSKIFMRIVSDELAAYADLGLLEPWEPANNPSFYEAELRKEVTFFHPLRWKKVRAMGVRSDRDDVLFEVLNGSSKYAVVHLTYAKERSPKFPVTHFFKDWQDVYKNRLLPDHKEWTES